MSSRGALDQSMVRAVAWNAAAKWISQVLSWASTVIVARLLTPYDYGLVGIVGLYTALAMLINQVGVGDAIVTLRDLTRRQIAQLNTVSALIGLGLTALSWALASPLAHFFSAPPLRAVVMVVGVTYVINAFQVVPRALLQKDLRFKLLASIEAVRVTSQIVTTITLAWLGFRYWSLVWGYIISSVVATGLTSCFRRHEFAIPHIAQLRRELRFSGHVLLSGIGWYVYDNADFLVAGRVLGEVPLGNYTIAWTISSAPVEKIGNLVTGVTPAFFSAIQNNKAELSRFFLRITEALSLVTVPASVGIALVADYLVTVLLGPKWLGVIGPLRLLGLFVAVRSVTTLMEKVLIAIGDAGFMMWLTLAIDVVMPVAFFIGSRWGTSGIAGAWVFAYPIVMIPLCARVSERIGIKISEYISAISPALSASAIMSTVVLFTRSLLPAKSHSLGNLSLLIISGALSYAAALLTFHRRRIGRLAQIVKGQLQGKQGSASA